MQIENLESRVLLSAGSLDRSFGTAGEINTSASDNNESIVVQKNGAIIVAGSTLASDGSQHGFLERFHPNGKLDTTFGVGGRVDLTSSQFSDVLSMTLTPDGKIVVVGSQASGNDLLARFTTKGVLDTKFGSAGITTLPANLSSPKVKVASDQNIVIGANLNLSPGNLVEGGSTLIGEILQYTRTGAVDTQFGTDGVVTAQLGAGHEIGDFEAFSNGKVEAYFVSSSQTSRNEDGNLELFNADGSPDSKFEQDTSVDVPAPYTYRFLPDGGFSIYLPTFGGGGAIIDYTIGGVPNYHFGTRGGSAVVPLPADDTTQLNAPNNTDRILVETGDRLLIVENGTTTPGGTTQYIALGGVTARGKIDHTFGKTGVVEATPADLVTAAATDGLRVLLIETVGGTPTAPVQVIVAYKL